MQYNLLYTDIMQIKISRTTLYIGQRTLVMNTIEKSIPVEPMTIYGAGILNILVIPNDTSGIQIGLQDQSAKQYYKWKPQSRKVSEI